MNSTSFYLQHAAFAGQESEWSRASFPVKSPAYPPHSYNTRRLDDMSVYSVEAALRALAERGIDPSDYGRYGILTLSHNGPSIYSETFFRQLLEEENPQMASPMLFTESVLNISASHLALAMKTRAPILALNAGLEDFFETLRQAGILLESGHMERAVFCAAEEFSPVCVDVFKTCPTYPGTSFRGGAVALLLSREPLPGDNVQVQIPPACSRAAAPALLQRLTDQGTSLFLSAFSSSRPEDAAFMDSPFASQMESDQGFTAMRTAELYHAARYSLETKRPAALVEADRETVRCVIFSTGGGAS